MQLPPPRFPPVPPPAPEAASPRRKRTRITLIVAIPVVLAFLAGAFTVLVIASDENPAPSAAAALSRPTALVIEDLIPPGEPVDLPGVPTRRYRCLAWLVTKADDFEEVRLEMQEFASSVEDDDRNGAIDSAIMNYEMYSALREDSQCFGDSELPEAVNAMLRRCSTAYVDLGSALLEREPAELDQALVTLPECADLVTVSIVAIEFAVAEHRNSL